MKSFFFGEKRSKIRVRIIHRRALYTGKYGTLYFHRILPIKYNSVLYYGGLWRRARIVFYPQFTQFTVLNIFQCSFCFTLTLKNVRQLGRTFLFLTALYSLKLLVRDCVVNEALLWRRQNHDTLKAAQSLPYSRLIAFKMTFTDPHPIWM